MSRWSKFAKVLPLINFVIASTALAFQIEVLYPWHPDANAMIERFQVTQAKEIDGMIAAETPLQAGIQKDLSQLQDEVKGLCSPSKGQKTVDQGK